MDNKEYAENYINCIAKLLKIIDSFPERMNKLFALVGFVRIESSTQNEFKEYWKKGNKPFLAYINKKINYLESTNDQNKYVVAYSLCVCFDSIITYEDTNIDSMISLHFKVPIIKDKPVLVSEPLNSNYRHIGFEIHPKFRVSTINEIFENEEGTDNKDRSVSNKDVFSGINSFLNNICYSKYDSCFKILDVVIDLPDDYKNEFLSVAFSPITNRSIIKFNSKTTPYKDMNFSTKENKPLSKNNKKYLKKRFDKAFFNACASNVDILFFPELLSVDELEETCFDYNKHVHELFEKAHSEQMNTPKLILLPSFRDDKSNQVSIVYQDGKVLGKQPKLYSYVNVDEHIAENIINDEAKIFVIVHIPGLNRIATLICSDFLTCSFDMQKKLFSDMGVSLLLVPSHSSGEQDFINKLSEFNKYGTSVIWGNCCGASKSPRIIGGCSIAGYNRVYKFNEYANCYGNCREGCIFLITIPSSYTRVNKKTIINGEIINHK
ncbi:MAG: hypothetical protein E7517_05120 [Ruminococcaceae bacterium]|nr:hypothetical protein [Oscillospiraceae bacterium]